MEVRLFASELRHEEPGMIARRNALYGKETRYLCDGGRAKVCFSKEDDGTALAILI